MMERTVEKLINVIANRQFVNCYSREFSPENQRELEQFLSKLKEEYKGIIYIDIDIQVFESCEDEEQEAKTLLEIINRELTGKGINNVDTQAISIANALHKWSKSLDRRTLLGFHSFLDLYNEKEKNVLRSLRKALRSRDEMGSYLGVLIVSNRKVLKWELFPESNLDERHVAFFELENMGRR